MAGKLMSVYYNPFSKAAVSPKIPDQKCLMSIGLRHENTKEIKVGRPTDAFNYVHTSDPTSCVLVLYPGLGAGMKLMGVQEAYVKSIPQTGFESYTPQACVLQSYKDHGDYSMGHEIPTMMDAGRVNYQLNPASPIAKWRLVSQGLRLACTNSDEDNDGWWESIRVTTPIDPNMWGMGVTGAEFSGQTADGSRPGKYGYAISPYFADPQWDPTELDQMVQHPTYRTGRVKDLHKVKFVLKPHDTDHDFNRVHNSGKVYATTEVSYGMNFGESQTGDVTDYTAGLAMPRSGNTGTNEVDASNLLHLLDSQIDSSFDTIMIRIHGRDVGTTNEPRQPTKIMAHLVSNQEVMYDSKSALAKFHTLSNAKGSTASKGFKPTASAQTVRPMQTGT